ncbi:NAD-dependent epimerase/dehydratase family protein [Paenibacillus sp. 1001270B_150601_E10]|uniref:NAD-dependent epimerase/dehydratase family protein n=1 Tax=Paenibacillus sp. 1001270B_150601_E10 TaxID=2787079 RepID=UPI0018A0F4BE|nr:NAD(P)H-binding protein [Paenibacillus sp. 1001270B_150601_E10]
MTKRALFLGATGLVGGHCLSLLTFHYDHIIVLTRRPLDVNHPKCEVHIVSFDNMEAFLPLFHVDDVYCCLGTTIKKAGSQAAFRKVDYEYPLTAARLAKRAGASRFLVITAMGSDQKSPFFYSRVKGELEADLESLNLHELHILQPSLILGDRSEFRFGEKFAAWLSPLFAWLLIGSLKRYRPIQARRIAMAMIEAATFSQPGIHRYRSDKLEEMAARYPS